MRKFHPYDNQESVVPYQHSIPGPQRLEQLTGELKGCHTWLST